MTVTQQAVDRCVQWAVENGSKIPSEYDFKYNKLSGTSCIASKAFTSTTEPLEIHKSIALTKTIAKRALEKYVTDPTLLSSLPPNALLKLFIVLLKKNFLLDFEFANNRQSDFYQAYMNVLPDDITSPLLWNDSEVALLQGSDLILKRNSILQNEIVPEFNAVTAQFTFPKDKNVELSLQDYIWAHLIVSSRGFPSILISDDASCKNEAFLWPIVDFLNHDSTAEVKWNYDEPYLTFTSNTETNGIAKGQEIFNNYGDNKTTDDLLLSYGFLPSEPVQGDYTMITLRVPSKEVVFECEKTHYIKFDDVLESSTDNSCVVKFKAYGKFTLPINLIKFFSYLCKLSKENFLSVRSTLEGLDQLLKIMDSKLKFYKKKLQTTKQCREPVISLIKNYKNVMKQIFQSNIDIIQQFEKNLIATSLKNNTVKSFKTCIKEDPVFQNSLLLVFGTFDYGKLKEKNLLQQVLLLYIVKQGKTSDEQTLGTTDSIIKNTFIQTGKEIKIDSEDIKEYTPLYSTFFPSLEKKIPEVYGNGWSLQDFVIAGTVVDRICWQRPINQEIFFIEQKPYSLM
ncbi:hypothetical protein ACO0QE_002319 [Hanseniaspora vineae]